MSCLYLQQLDLLQVNQLNQIQIKALNKKRQAVSSIAIMRCPLSHLICIHILCQIICFIRSEKMKIKKFQRIIYSKFQEASEICTQTLPYDNQTIYLGNCVENIYIVQLGVGTPAQYFQFQIDTGSNIAWLPLVKYTGFGYNSDASSTFTSSSIQQLLIYGDGSHVLGNLGTEVMTVKNTSISVTSQMLWVRSQSKNMYPQPITGLVGMGSSNDPPNFLDLAYNAGQINTPVFAIQLKLNNTDSALYYNQIPDNIISNAVMIPIYGQGYWQIELLRLQTNSKDLTKYSSKNVIIDSGTSLLQFNSELYQQVKSQYFSQCQIYLGIPLCSCQDAQNNWPTFSFTFQGVKVFIYPQNYTEYIISVKSLNCTYRIGTLAQSTPVIILGDVFFRNYIVIFDKNKQKIGISGNYQEIQMIGPEFFALSQYIMIGLLGILLALSGVLVMQLKVNKNKGNKQLSLYMLQI